MGDIYEMVKHMLKNEPQSTFVWDVYPDLATQAAKEIALEKVKEAT